MQLFFYRMFFSTNIENLYLMEKENDVFYDLRIDVLKKKSYICNCKLKATKS